MAVGEGSTEPDNGHTLTPEQPKPIEDDEDEQPTAAQENKEESEEEKGDGDGEKEEDHDDDDDDEEEEEEEEEEPRLKYAPLTKNLGMVYRNGDATSTFMVSGDKMIVGTHNGKIHVFSMPLLQSVRSYRAHQASVSSMSISPYPPPLPIPTKLDAAQRLAAEAADDRPGSRSPSSNAKSSPRQLSVARTPSNDIYIATSSIDGHVCVQSLIDEKDVQLRNFGRPVQAVALSPEYKSDKSYLSGGQAGTLVLTVGGKAGKSTDATTTGAAAAASGWLGSIGLGTNTGTDKILHSGEGTISTIKWSLSGKYVLWVNEEGIKIMRSHLKLDSGESALEWKRISHISRPNRKGWEELAAVQKARAEWVDRTCLESDDDSSLRRPPSNGHNSRAADRSDAEEVVVGWGDMAWIIRVTTGTSQSSSKGQNSAAGSAEVMSIIRFDDCMIAGVSLYTPTLLLVIAYIEKKSKPSKKVNEGTPRGRSHRHNGLKPELRLIDINTKEELETDALPVSRFETLSSSDYHLGVLYPIKIPAQLAQKGYLSQIGSGVTAVGSGLATGAEVVGQGVWDATMYGPRMLGANRLFDRSDTGSIRSGKPGTDKSLNPKPSNYLTGWIPGIGSSIFGAENEELKAVATTQGMKIFMMSPYDCIVAVKRTLSDRVQWLEKMEQYSKAWELLDEHPEAATTTSEPSEASSPPTPSKASSVAQSSNSVSSPTRERPKPTLAEFFADSASMIGSPKPDVKGQYSVAEKEKRRIGELWLQQLTKAGKWSEAGEVASKVLNTTSRWEHWAWQFIRNNKFDEISPYMPAMELIPPLSSSTFEVVLGHYISRDRKRFQELIDQWPSDLFDVSSITTAIQEQLSSGTAPGGSDDWRMLNECLAKLYLADGHYKEALRCYIQLQDADTALSLVKDHHLVEAILDDIPDFVLLRITHQQLKTASQAELEELSSEPIKLLVDEASNGVVDPDAVVHELQKANLNVFLYFYFRGLWQGTGRSEARTVSRHRFSTANLAANEGKLLVDGYPDLAVELFAAYDRTLLMEFLQSSTLFNFDAALKTCEKNRYIEEEVYLLSKTGSLKKALYLIIDELQDVSKAIAFAKEQDDKGLWEDLLEYSMSRPRFISGLLAEVGTAIDPITLVKRIPSGIEIEGLKDGLKKMIREYDLQDSISAGAAKVLSSEVAVNMDILRRGRRRGIKFDVPIKPKVRDTKDDLGISEITVLPAPGTHEQEETKPGYCATCEKAFTGDDSETLIGFACGHVYHVSCLFKDEDPVSMPKREEEDEEDFDYGFTRSIAAKVTNARLLRDRVKMLGGCKVCRTRKEKIKEVIQ
ncbi:Vacuolar protein sorting-associated protein 41 [Neophaeococcomyces mojaviensis]|uniref:Vacuolar protein sorting-associated protein 41 n=1 Tax=Neophaeococcomyces mojaviensis TaxID=3383035 RepID=A0ACC2ZTN0_9EURO|nr:Vacuolar protein sorting-associated protein 41 [Knufia sp. JES_112]